MSETIRASEVVPGDFLDLEEDSYADAPDGGGLNWAFRFELAEVISTEVETPDCIVIETSLATVGFPPEHELRIDREAMESYARIAPLPRASVYEAYSNRHAGTFYGPGAEDAAADLCGALIDRYPGTEYSLSVSDERCPHCATMFWHEAAYEIEGGPKGARCPYCAGRLPKVAS